MTDYFKDKVVIVTGASKGIGRSIVHSLLASGAKVAGVARSKTLLDEIATDTSNLSGEFFGVVCDVSNRDAVSSSMAAITDRFGVADILINNAGIGLMGPSLETSEEDKTKCFDINFYGAINCIKYIAPKMIERRSGTIVNVTSIVAKYGLPTVSFYSAAKAALAAYSQSLRAELAPAGISVITVYPGNTDTEFRENTLVTKNYIPKRTGSKQLNPEYVAEEILLAIRKGKAEVIIGRPAKILVISKSLLPSFTEYMLRKEFDIVKWYRNNSQKKDMPFSYIDESIKSGVALMKMDEPCHYHKSTEFVNWWNVLPDGLQPSLYYVLYPYLLAIAYGADIPVGQAFTNPTLRDAKPVYIRRKPPYLLMHVKNVIKTLLSPIAQMGRNKSIPKIETHEGEYLFDLGTEGNLCPAAFRSLFPFLVNNHLRNGEAKAEFAWKVSCPDHVKNLQYGGGENPDDTSFESICYWGSSTKIETKSLCKYKTHNDIVPTSLEEIMRELGFPCPTLLSVMYGYYLTLAKGGELGFYTKNFDSAIAQCPNPKSRVVMEICRTKDTIDFKTLDVMGYLCPRGIKKNDTFSLPKNVEKNKFCLDAFNSLFLSCGLAKFSTKPLDVNCVLQDCAASWRVQATQAPAKIECARSKKKL